jgi:hyperosmotically inducible protein
MLRKHRSLYTRLAAPAALIAAVGVIGTGFEGCWAAAAGAGAEAGYALTQDNRTAGETVTDQRITSTVKGKLLADSRVSGLDINVDTFKSIVTLRGTVRTSQEADAAIELAKNVSGVRSVNSKLVLVP